MQARKLEPCPMCGEPVDLIETPIGKWIECNYCGMSTGQVQDEDILTDRWNAIPRRKVANCFVCGIQSAESGGLT